MQLSGLEPVTMTAESNFMNVGERTNVTGSAKFLKLIKEDKYEDALAVALDQVQGGAQVIDINKRHIRRWHSLWRVSMTMIGR